MAEQLQQQVALGVDPVIHGVARDERRLFHLIEHAELQLGVDVAEEEVARIPELGRELGAEVGEHAQTGLEGLAARQVVGVLGLPAKRLARGLLHAREVHAARLERLEGAERIIRAHHADHLDGVEDHAGGAEEHRRSTGRVGRLTERRVHRVERDRADHEQTHVTSDPGR